VEAFLRNHAAGIAAMDFLIVPTVGFKLLFVLVILRHQRRRLTSLTETTNPTAEWIAHQITDAFPWNEVAGPSYPGPRRILWSCRLPTSRRHGHPRSPTVPRSPSRMGMWNASSARCAGNASITSSFGEAHLRRVLAA
jgi:hypothetical protein